MARFLRRSVRGRGGMADETMNLGETLGDLRRARGVSLGSLARAAQVSKASLVDWETGRYVPSGAALERVLDALEADGRTRARLLVQASPRFARTRLAHEPGGAPVEMGTVLRALRLRRGWTQAEAARAAGVRQGTLAKWETGEAEPDAERLHTALFALGASGEEAVALTRSVRGQALDSELPYEARIDRIGFRVAVELRELLLIGIEAELWWRSTRDPAADAPLAYAIGMRAQQSLLRGDLEDAGAHARRSLRLARAAGTFESAAHAVYAGAWLGRQTPDRAARTARNVLAWAARIQTGHLQGWLCAIAALAEARVDDGEAGLARLRGLAAEHDAGSSEWGYYTEDRVEAALVAGRLDEARASMETLRAHGLGEGAARRVAAAHGELPSDETMTAMRKSPEFLVRHEAERLERLGARVRRGGAVRLE